MSKFAKIPPKVFVFSLTETGEMEYTVFRIILITVSFFADERKRGNLGKNADIIEELVLRECRHCNAEQIFSRVKADLPSVVLATVYNNLNRLVAEGKLRRIRVAGQADCFDAPARHDHLRCVKCGAMQDVTLPDYAKTFSKETGEEVLAYELQLSYVCPRCR